MLGSRDSVRDKLKNGRAMGSKGADAVMRKVQYA